MIAPGNHWIYDSLRGAPPPGEAMGAAAPDTPGGVSLRGARRVGATLAVVPDLVLDIPKYLCYHIFNN